MSKDVNEREMEKKKTQEEKRKKKKKEVARDGE